ncbi:hypothetical protein E1297_00150, partial [Roseibium sp. RKSG952]|nr:hypothetical protein [Roseibium sp. RKSG952]
MFGRVVEAVVEAPRARLSALPLLGREDRERLVREFNATNVTFPENRTVLDLFAAQVRRAPDAIAVSDARR